MVQNTVPLTKKWKKVHYNGDNQIQNFHLGRYIVGFMVGNYVYGSAEAPT